MTEIAELPIRTRLDRIKCSSDGIYLSGHNVRAGLAYALGAMGPCAIGDTEHIIRLVADGKTLGVQSREALSDACREALIHAWSVAVIGDGTSHVGFKVIPVAARKGGDADG